MARRNFKREQQNPDPISGPPVNNEDHLVSSGDTIAMDIDEETADGIVHDPRYAKTANATSKNRLVPEGSASHTNDT